MYPPFSVVTARGIRETCLDVGFELVKSHVSAADGMETLSSFVSIKSL